MKINMAEYWFTDTETLRNFGSVLTTADILSDSEEFTNFLTKPFEYNDMYDKWMELDMPEEGDEKWDEFVDAITDDDDEAEGE